MHKLKRKIYFCFPYIPVGGVPVLFLRMAQSLADKFNSEIYVIDYKDGYMARTNRHERVKLVEYRDDQKVIIPADGYLILQSMTPWSIFPSLQIHDEAMIFFWNCHPYNLVPTVPGIRNWMYSSVTFTRLALKTVLSSYAKKMRRFLQVLEKNKAIAFMDRTNIEVTEKCLDYRITNREYLPVAIDYCSLDINLDRQRLDEVLRVAWVGRVADFKVHILIYTMQSLATLALRQQQKMSFKVIGSGEFLNFLKTSVSDNDYFEIEFLGDKSSRELKDFLKSECDILCAMGTSALEGASLGVPTILLDIAYGPVKGDYLFRFLHEETGCVLGDMLSKKSFQKGNKSLENILLQVREHFREVSQKSFEYCRTFHSINSVSDKLIDCLTSNELTFSQLKKAKIFTPSYVYLIFRSLRKKFAFR